MHGGSGCIWLCKRLQMKIVDQSWRTWNVAVMPPLDWVQAVHAEHLHLLLPHLYF